VLLGDTNVGKSCLVVRFARGEYFDYQVRQLSSMPPPSRRGAAEPPLAGRRLAAARGAGKRAWPRPFPWRPSPCPAHLSALSRAPRPGAHHRCGFSHADGVAG